MSDNAIEVSRLHKRFGRKHVLRGVDLNVPAGSTFGLLGRNGEGKTTTIKALLGLMKFDAGRCRVLGMDPARDGVAIRGLVGYMAENQVMYDWMTVRQICDWVASFYETWDSCFAYELLRRFELDHETKVGALSKGQSSKLALALALAHRPAALLLDDPTLGLDPVARKDFLREIIGQLQDRRVTVLFSSHLLYEIEPICDYVAILDEGRIIRADRTEALRDGVKRFIVPLPQSAEPIQVPGLLDVQIEGDTAALVSESPDAAAAVLQSSCAGRIEPEHLNLDEIFEALVIGRRSVDPFQRGDLEPVVATAGASESSP